MDSNDLARYENQQRLAKNVERVNKLSDAILSEIDKFTYTIEEREIDVYPEQIFVDINFTNRHHTRTPFSVFTRPEKAVAIISDIVYMVAGMPDVRRK